MAGVANLVTNHVVNSTPADILSSEQCDDQLAANSNATRDFIENMDLSVIKNQERMQVISNKELN